MNDLTSGFCDLHTCGETDRLLKTPVESIRDESSTFCKPYVAFMDDFTFGFTTFLLFLHESLKLVKKKIARAAAAVPVNC